MEGKNTLIKINSQISDEQCAKIIKTVSNFEGVISVKIDGDILRYELSEWASDYDIMVEIMNALESEGLDSEPLFEGGEEMKISAEHDIDCDDCHEHQHENCSCHEHDHENCSCHEHEHEHDHVHTGLSCSCGCEHDELEDKNERKYKLVELSIAILVMIAGVILNAFPQTKKVADYVFIVSYAIAGYSVVINGIISLLKLKPFNENTLMAISSIAAIFLGEVFEAVGIMLLFQIGELFEHSAISSAESVIEKLKSYKQDKVVKIGEGGIETTVSPNSVCVGDVIVLRAGDKNSLDGEIIEGSSDFDTKIITGESVYRSLKVGDTVLGGFICIDGVIKLKVTKSYSDSAVNTIAKTIEESGKNKTKPEKFLNSFAKWYTPTVVIIALLLAFVTPAFYPLYRTGLYIWGKRAVMLLCVSCPCSLVISVPLAYFIGVANSAKHGVIIKNSISLEQLSKIQAVVFDKTGTLTEGVLAVSKIVSAKKYQGRVLSLINLCEKYSNHPIAVAIKKKAGETVDDVTEYKEFAGKGITCVFNGENLVCGNEKFLQEKGVELPIVDSVGIKIYLAVNGEFAGAVVLSDVVRKTARGCVLELNDLGIDNTVMLTGDNKAHAQSVKEQLNIKKLRADLLPEGKVEQIEKIISKTSGTVVFVGDGVNDAPVIKRSDVGVSLGTALDVAVESADVVITNNDLSKIPYIIKLAKRTASIVRQNVIFSLLIKFAVMILSVLGVVTSLWFAIGADVGLLILAILNSIRNKTKVI